MKSLLVLAALGVALPAMAQDRNMQQQATPPTKATGTDHAVGHKAKKRQTTKPQTPLTTESGTTTARPSPPSGVVPPGAPGTKDPTLPGSPPN